MNVIEEFAEENNKPWAAMQANPETKRELNEKLYAIDNFFL